MLRRACMFLGFFCTAAACGAVSNEKVDAGSPFDADPNAPDAASTDGMPTVDAASCGAGFTCIPEAPVNWAGPVRLYEGPGDTPAPTCPSYWPIENQTARGGLTPEGTCDCACAPATGMSCGGSARVYEHTSASCFSINAPYTTISPNQCSSMNINSSSYYTVNNPDTIGGSCSASVVNNLATPSWGQTIRSCGNDTLTPGGCEAGNLCAPNGDAQFDRVCILSSGDNACPINSPYNQRVVFYDNFTDGRSCGGCTCGAASGQCNPKVTFTDSCGSFPLFLGQITPSECEHVNPGPVVTYATYVPEPTATCAPSAGMVAGSVSPTGPTTYCCL